MQTTKVGIIGCGNISDIYFKSGKTFNNLQVIACADLDNSKAEAKARQHDVQPLSPSDLLSDPEIEIVINLTVPAAHFDVCTAAIGAGKHVYVEKPLSVSRAQGKALIDQATVKNVRIGSAPDTFLGAGLQTCRKVVDDGVIGDIVAATAFMVCHGHESWHPSPEFYYKPGGGPMFDMGPYYLSALVNLIGPMQRVSGSARVTFPQRTITSRPKFGQVMEVETPTHIAGTIDFKSGAIGTIITSFDVWSAHLPVIELYGTQGSIAVPDPNSFGGRVTVKRHDDPEWHDIALTHGYADNSRGIGVADMAYAIRSGRPHRASGELAFHVLDIMQGFLEFVRNGPALHCFVYHFAPGSAATGLAGRRSGVLRTAECNSSAFMRPRLQLTTDIGYAFVRPTTNARRAHQDERSQTSACRG